MNVRKAKNELEFFRDNEPTQTSFDLRTVNPTNTPRIITEFTQSSTSYRLFTRISLTADDNNDYRFRIVRGSTVLYDTLSESQTGVHFPMPIFSPESIKLESGETIRFEIIQLVAQVRNFYLNLAWMTFPN